MVRDPARDPVRGAAPRRVVLLRHGRTEWNASGRWQGHLDPDLDELGVAQAERAARLLAALAPDAIVASDLRRAARTAASLARVTRLPVHSDPDLRETYIGAWQGLTAAEVELRYPEDFSAWRRGDVHVHPGGGETRLEVSARVTAAVRRALADVPPAGLLVVVTHGGAARVGIAGLLGLPHGSWGALGGLANCCWSVLTEGEPGWRLLEHNAGTLPEPVLVEEG